MRVVPVNWADFETAFERNAPDLESFLDTRSGEIITVSESAIDFAEQRARVQAAPDAMIRIEPAPSREQYKWMERFVVGVSDGPLKERLLIAIDGKGAFRRFKDVLLNYPVDRERWFNYRAGLLHWNMLKWLEKEGLAAREAPPWELPAEPPTEEIVLERPPASAEGPGDVMRRQARELLEQLPAAELNAAIAFLEFLKQRSRSEVGSVRAVPPTPPKRTAA